LVIPEDEGNGAVHGENVPLSGCKVLKCGEVLHGAFVGEEKNRRDESLLRDHNELSNLKQPIVVSDRRLEELIRRT